MDDVLSIPAVRTDDSLELPRYAKAHDAGLDLRSAIDASLAPGERQAVPCGLKIAIPQGYAGLVIPRSGLAAKSGITIVNAPGLIDAGYRGEIMAILMNADNTETFHISKGDRIAQLVIIKIPEVRLVEVDQLDITSRGETGFGSSGR